MKGAGVNHVDVAIVGAGPAGSASALMLGGHGLRVQLMDRAVFPRDKVCGEALCPGALPFLEAFGLLSEVERRGARRYHGARIETPDGYRAEARYPAGRYGLAVPRELLDALLVERAMDAVEVRQGVSVEAIAPQAGGHVLTLRAGPQRERLWARAVISAEGRFARLLTDPRREAGKPRRFAVVATLDGVEALGDWLEFHLVEPSWQVVICPQAPTRAAIAIVLDGSDAHRHAPELIKDFLGALRRDPLLAERLDGACLIKPPRGMGLGAYQPAARSGEAWLAVGDAVGAMDPLTGEGMYRAFRSAQLASETLLAAFSAGDLSARRLRPYAVAIRREFDPSVRFVEAVVALSRRPRLARLALSAIAQDPVLAGRMGAYQGALAPASGFFSLSTIARFAWGSLRATRTG